MNIKELTTMIEGKNDLERRTRQALLLWGVFIIAIIILNGTVQFAMGIDMHAWSYSETKSILFGLIIYAGLFLVVPLILIKGWETVRDPEFLLPLLVAITAITLFNTIRGIAAISIGVLVYLHWRFDLSEFGIRSRGWKGDVVVVLFLGLLSLVLVFLQPGPHSFMPVNALLAALDRLFANPASTVENLFYFGFLTERLSNKTKKLTPFLIGLMYTTHEVTNPEYWYEEMNFALVFFGVSIISAIYLWRRSVLVIWISDGLMRFISRLFL
ncbi:MAG: hypothetical protein ACE5HW_05625 [Candidatus Methanofastidiosia archaeon]